MENNNNIYIGIGQLNGNNHHLVMSSNFDKCKKDLINLCNTSCGNISPVGIKKIAFYDLENLPFDYIF
jgi:hypothetical protein